MMMPKGEDMKSADVAKAFLTTIEVETGKSAWWFLSSRQSDAPGLVRVAVWTDAGEVAERAFDLPMAPTLATFDGVSEWFRPFLR